MTDAYSSSEIIFRNDPGYTILPSLCTPQITCNSVTQQPEANIPSKMACQPFVDNKIKWTLTSDDHQNQVVAPGLYEYEYQVCIGSCTTAALIKTFIVSITVTDPCKNPTFVKAGVTTPQTYTITQEDQSFTLDPLYSIDPSWCPVELTILAVTGEIQDDLTMTQDTQTVTFGQITDSLTKSGVDDGKVEETYTVEIDLKTKDYDQVTVSVD